MKQLDCFSWRWDR